MINYGAPSKARRLSVVEKLTIYCEYLNKLRDSGVTNMFGARPYLMREFPELDKDMAAGVLSHWMQTFDEPDTSISAFANDEIGA